MATVNENVQRIKTAKASIKASIEAKGVTVPADALIDTYAAKIDEIQTGGGSGTVDFSQIGYDNDTEIVKKLNGDLEYSKTKYNSWDPSRTNIGGEYHNDTDLVYVPKIDTGNVTDMRSCFSGCSNLISVPLLDTSKVEIMVLTFQNCEKLEGVPLFNTACVTDMSYCFSSCTSLTSIPAFNTAKVTKMRSCFQNCDNLISIPLLDMSQAKEMLNCFSSCPKLENMGGLKELKVSTSLSLNRHLTKESLLNVIRNLGQADPAFEASPVLTLGQTNLDKLTAEEIAEGTAKGWQIVA